MSSVPEDVISLILCQLPVKSLLRFKCISKQFRALIDSECFIQLHLRNFVKTNTDFSFIIEGKLKICSLNAAGSPTWQTRKLDSPFGFSRTEILGSSNGLICIVKSEKGYSGTFIYRELPRKTQIILHKIAFWNPSASNKLLILPIDPMIVRGLSTQGSVSIHYAFGHDSVNNDYKVLKIVKKCMIPSARVYSLTTNSWREIITPYNAMSILMSILIQYVIVQESFHWLIMQENKEATICAFDIGGEEFCSLSIPDIGDDGHLRHLVKNLDVLGQWLCIYSHDTNTGHFHMWVMKEYGKKDSWVKLFSRFRGLPRDPRRRLSLCFRVYPVDVNDEEHEKVLYRLQKSCFQFCYDRKFIWYDIKKKTCHELFPIPGTQWDDKLCAYVETLVSPFFSEKQN